MHVWETHRFSFLLSLTILRHSLLALFLLWTFNTI